MRRAVPAIILLVAVAPVLSGCKSTQATSAELAKHGSHVLVQEKGLSVSKESTDVKVVDSAVFSDQNGAAVVVTLKNESDHDLQNVPISIDVLNPKGKSVFKNDLPGLEPALVSVPFIKAGETVDWVNDQVLATGPVASVSVKVGEVPPTTLPDLPKIDVGDPKLETDPVSGTVAVGPVVNRSGAEQHNLLLYGVARKGDKIVAAGRGLIGRLKDSTKPVNYHIFFIGNPTGAKVEVTHFPEIEKEPAP